MCVRACISKLFLLKASLQKLLTGFLAPLAIGQTAYVVAWCLSCVHLSVSGFICVLTFILNIFFSETTNPSLMKFHRNVPARVLFRIS